MPKARDYPASNQSLAADQCLYDLLYRAILRNAGSYRGSSLVLHCWCNKAILQLMLMPAFLQPRLHLHEAPPCLCRRGSCLEGEEPRFAYQLKLSHLFLEGFSAIHGEFAYAFYLCLSAD